jgi:hypothetical protein
LDTSLVVEYKMLFHAALRREKYDLFEARQFRLCWPRARAARARLNYHQIRRFSLG